MCPGIWKWNCQRIKFLIHEVHYVLPSPSYLAGKVTVELERQLKPLPHIELVCASGDGQEGVWVNASSNLQNPGLTKKNGWLVGSVEYHLDTGQSLFNLTCIAWTRVSVVKPKAPNDSRIWHWFTSVMHTVILGNMFLYYQEHICCSYFDFFPQTLPNVKWSGEENSPQYTNYLSLSLNWAYLKMKLFVTCF